MPTSPHLVDSQSQLDELCDNLADIAGDPIACDTEFVRTQTYWPQLCVIQLAVDGRHAAVDLLADLDTTALREQLLKRTEVEIFHAAKQDLEALYSIYEELPQSIFDTQVAAGLLGFHAQIGYASLVRDLLGIELPKDQTRTDWSRRPLTEAQITYALEDVAHLHELYDILGDRLRTAGRYDWALEDSALLIDPSLYYVPSDTAWQRLSSVPYLPVPVQARARRLAGWREDRARNTNRPRQWILADKTLLAIAHANPSHASELSGVDGLPPAIARRQGNTIIDVIRAANADGGELELRQAPVPIAPDKNRMKQLAGIVRAAAEALDIAPEVLATRKDMAGVLNGREDLRVLTGWRRAVVGERLLEAGLTRSDQNRGL